VLVPELAVTDAQAERRLVAAVTAHADWIWRSLRRLGVPERDVADAAQHVFLTFLHHAHDIEAGKESGYLAAVAVKVAANFRRKHERAPLVLAEEPEAFALHLAPTPEDLVGEKQLREELDRRLETLPFEQRAVFVLFELEGFTLPEIASALVIPLGTATSRLRRARLHFEAWIAERKREEP
jgi:RNA polymerase sigma-70 factor (ECF subfamily)